MARILTIGGTFNPVHTGHLRLAIEAIEGMGFDRIEWIPCFSPRHKSDCGLLPFALRLALLRAATDGLADSVVDDIESRLPSPSYTVQTLEALAARAPLDERHFLLGQGEFARLHKWHRGREVAALAHVVVAARSGGDGSDFHQSVAEAWPDSRPVDPPAGSPAAYELVPGRWAALLPLPQLDISASLVRQRWLAGRNLDLLLPAPVLGLLEEQRNLVMNVWAKESYSKINTKTPR